MYLKQLDIIGFKSFPTKTSIKFSPGKTAIVGPNGCGKTNILDAIRWVMGEQKITLLRGSKMEEVIFAGTRDMAALGMAEVTLTMINNRGVLPVEYNEVQITRRLFRSGEAEYLLNKVPCRLKDITELFFDTGAGAHSYSVIQQEMIDSVISDKAEERRFLFEEAAGITKYKQRKKAALRKLDATEQDLQRLRDIYAEVKTQVNSLNRQQKKAERYQALSEMVKKWELYFASMRVKRIDTEKRQIKDTLDKLSTKMLEFDSQTDVHGSELEALKSKQIELDQQLSKVGQELYESSETAHSHEKEISILKEKRTSANSLIERNKKEIESLEKKSVTLSEQAVDTGAVLNKLRTEVETLRTNLKTAQEVQAEADKNLLAAKNAKEIENKKLFELEGRISSGKTEDVNIKEQLEELQKVLSQLSERISETKNNREIHAENLEEVKINASTLIENRAELQKSLDDQKAEFEKINMELGDITKKLAAAISSKEACEAQINLLRQVIFSFGNSESGIKTILEKRNNWQGVVGTVTEKFVPKAGYEKSVEAALGDISKFLICNSKETAELIITHLKSVNKGRVGIIVPDTGTINPVVKRPDLSGTGFLGWLDTLVSTDDNLKPLMQAVLAHIAVFEAGTDPTEILARLPYGFKAVSTDGVVYSRNTIVGGSSESLQLYSRKEQLTNLEKQLGERISEIESLSEQENKLKASVDSIENNIQTETDLVQHLDGDISTNQKKIDETNYELRLAENELSRLNKEFETTKSKLTLLEQKQYSLGLDWGKLDEEKQSVQNSLDESAKMLEEIEQAANEAMSKVSKLQISEVEIQSRIEQSENRINHSKELLNEIAESVSTKKQEIKSAEEDIEHATRTIGELETKLKLTFESREEITQSQTELKNRHSELVQKIDEIEKHNKVIRTEKDKYNQEHHQNEMRYQSFESESNSITERIREDYDLDITEYQAENPDPEKPEAEARVQLRQDKDALKKFGAVNLLALEEFKTASERKEFLDKQLGDLESARNDLLATITKINKTARDLFEETFEKVKSNFQMLFTELFEGGEAGLYLENPDDPLESNIEITARPKGKKLQSITMMSGGERALTAISLLFSLYLVKPSAYCVLDEIDAPLDDSNCRRFLKLIAKFANNTQFIIITHNKITMEAANNLYGVTMVNPGISQIVAVKFNEIETKDGEIVISIADQSPENETTDEDRVPDKVVERMTSKVTTGDPSRD